MELSLTAVILAAGAGSRLGELGRQFSKPMVPVAGRPLIAWVLRRLQQSGVTRFIVVAHPSDLALAQHLETQHPQVSLVLQAERRGIAAALSCAIPWLDSDDAYLACACDSLFPVRDMRRLIALGRDLPKSAVVGVLEMSIEATRSRSAVRLAGDRITAIVEKPGPGDAPSALVAMPLYWLPREFTPQLDVPASMGTESYVSTALSRFADTGGVVLPCPISERLEITTAADIESVSLQLSMETPDGP